jgi:phenylacetate-CoA ligase
MPFIRYAVGDIGVPSDEKCSCGNRFPLMKVVEGRRNSFLILPDGTLMSPNKFTVAMFLFKEYANIDRFRIIQKRKDLFDVLIKKRNDSVDEKSMKAALTKHLNKMLNLDNYDITFDIQFTNYVSLEKTGKLNAIISDLKDD